MKGHARHILILSFNFINMSRTILLGHGSGGKLTADLIKKSFIKYFDNQVLKAMTDSAIINIDNNNNLII